MSNASEVVDYQIQGKPLEQDVDNNSEYRLHDLSDLDPMYNTHMIITSYEDSNTAVSNASKYRAREPSRTGHLCRS